MLTDISLLLSLIVLNGIFALSEIAIVSSRRGRLVQMAAEGSRGAQRALQLTAEPTRFLSSVQIGITTIGILSGAIGEGVIARRLQAALEQFPLVAPYAHAISMTVMVAVLTYVSLIIGELVPKRLALTQPETIASLIARPMQVIAAIGRPLVNLLSASTDAVLRLLGARSTGRPGVTVEEIRILLQQGAEEGLLESSEHAMVTNVLNLDDRHIGAFLTPRSDISYLDLRDPESVTRARFGPDSHSVLPLCDGGLDHVVGFVRATRILEHLLRGQALDLEALAEPPLFVPETMTLKTLLEEFKRRHLPLALVVDEFGGIEGLVSLTDVISSIVGDLPSDPDEDPLIVRREDGSWLLDGAIDLEVVARELEASSLTDDEVDAHYHTLGGLAMAALGRVPRIGDVFSRGGYRFEIVDMDRNRVDRVMVTRIVQPS